MRNKVLIAMVTSSKTSGDGSLRGKRVLVVDDEDLMRDVTAMMIEDVGGVPVVAADGAAAIEIFRREPAAVDCLVLDFSMPGMDGYELLMALRGIRPALPAVMISGLGSTREVSTLVMSGKLRFLSKPFRQDELVTAIEKQLSDQ